MISYEVYLAIGQALAQGLSIREVAKKLQVHRKTVRKYRAQGGYLARKKPKKSRSLIDAHKPLIRVEIWPNGEPRGVCRPTNCNEEIDSDNASDYPFQNMKPAGCKKR